MVQRENQRIQEWKTMRQRNKINRMDNRKKPGPIAFLGFPGGASGKEPICQCRIAPGVGKSLGAGHGSSLQHSSLENPMDRGPSWATVPWGHKESDKTDLAQLPFLFAKYWRDRVQYNSLKKLPDKTQN